MTEYTINNAAELAVAFENAAITRDDVLILKAGTYAGEWVANVGGTSGHPVIIKPCENESVTIDGSFTFGRDYLEVYDIEFLNSHPTRENISSPSITMNMDGSRLIGCNIHDMRNSVYFMGSGIGGIEECIIKNNGYFDDIANPLSGHGYDIYTHNNGGGQRDIKRNLFYSSVSQYSLHAYSPSNKIDDYQVEDNIFLQSPWIGGAYAPNRLTFKRNWLCGDYSLRYQCLYIANVATVAGDDVVIDANAIWNTYLYLGDDMLTNLVETNNLVYKQITGWAEIIRAGWTTTENPVTLVKIIEFTKSNRWLGSVAIYNRDSAATVAVDFSSLALTVGNYYDLINGHNTNEKYTFRYTGVSVDVPMDATTWTAAQEIGAFTPQNWFPKYGAFVIEESSYSANIETPECRTSSISSEDRVVTIASDGTSNSIIAGVETGLLMLLRISVVSGTPSNRTVVIGEESRTLTVESDGSENTVGMLSNGFLLLFTQLAVTGTPTGRGYVIPAESRTYTVEFCTDDD